MMAVDLFCDENNEGIFRENSNIYMITNLLTNGLFDCACIDKDE